ncbi:MAG TPA: hypothetical protein VLS93_15075 [Anaeromyxobacteraceae bacterium]|nr:hypothetical protein [Anaeromyxobacteraceae bacterium]
MRRFGIAVALLSLAACGGDDAPPALFGGFTPLGGGALLVPAQSCTLGTNTVTLSAVAVGLTSYADACDVVAATEAYVCGDKASATIVFGIGIRMNAWNLPIADAGTGTWVVTSNPQADGNGTAELAVAVANQSDAACASRPGSPLEATSGRVTLAAVSDVAATGDVSLGFENGSRFAEPFDVPVCPASFDLCAALNGTTACGGPYPTPCVP